MTLINPEQLWLLNEPTIDNDHRKFIEIVNRAEQADNNEFKVIFQELLEHIESHFAYENQLMDSSQFPAIAEHKGEHARILGQLHQFAERVNKGRVQFARSWVLEQMPSWFQLHLTTMDSALMAHVNRTTVVKTPA